MIAPGIRSHHAPIEAVFAEELAEKRGRLSRDQGKGGHIISTRFSSAVSGSSLVVVTTILRSSKSQRLCDAAPAHLVLNCVEKRYFV